MRVLTVLSLLTPLALTACGGGSSGPSAVAPFPHPGPGQEAHVSGVPEGDTVVIDHFGDPHLVEH